jgi:hypothetical protein
MSRDGGQTRSGGAAALWLRVSGAWLEAATAAGRRSGAGPCVGSPRAGADDRDPRRGNAAGCAGAAPGCPPCSG